MLYDVLPNAPRPSSDLTKYKSPATPPVDGVIGLVTQTPAKNSSNKIRSPTLLPMIPLTIHLALVKP